MQILPRRALNNYDILHFAKGIPHFRGVFMRNALPKNAWKKECGIINMDDKDGPGTHWTAYIKNGNDAYYFDSFGDLSPPLELKQYLRGSRIQYNYNRYQQPNSFVCGHLCLEYLYKNVPDILSKR